MPKPLRQRSEPLGITLRLARSKIACDQNACVRLILGATKQMILARMSGGTLEIKLRHPAERLNLNSGGRKPTRQHSRGILKSSDSKPRIGRGVTLQDPHTGAILLRMESDQTLRKSRRADSSLSCCSRVYQAGA